jgi:hypothetical protein
MVCDTQTIFITLSEARRLEVLYVQVRSKIPSRRHEHYSQMEIISTFILSSIPCTFSLVPVTMVCDTQTIFITLSEARRLEVLYIQVRSIIPSRRHEHYSQMGIISTFILSSIPCTFFSSTWNDPSLLKKI